MKKIIIFTTIIIVGLVAYLWSSAGNSDVPDLTASPTPEVSNNISPSTTPVASTSPEATEVSNVKTFVVVGKPFSFTPNQIIVDKGDTVKIVFQNASGTHDWRIDQFNAQTNIINGGKEETIEFVADKVGTFEYYCSVGTHRQLGMKGNLIVQ